MDRRKLIQYILLNIFVSASVTGGILFWYDRNYRAVVQPSAQILTGDDKAQIEPQGDIPIKISAVIGAGNLSTEIVVVKYEGKDQLNIKSWQLKDEDGNAYTFPNLILYPNGATQVHTIAGKDTVVDLYWGIGEPVWSSGENAKLFDSQGNLRAIYKTP
ncbi:MAG: lamin tail domain-containing protein [Anaerolineales bacterium]|nr:lamin tail domain-containing protein [Anaerolineales bacterium]